MKSFILIIFLAVNLYSQIIEYVPPYPSGTALANQFVNSGKVKYTVSLNGIFKTNDTAIVDYLALPTDRPVRNIAGSALDTNLILANMMNTLVMSTDGGKNWKIIQKDSTTNFTSKFKVNPKNANVIYNSRHLNELWVTYNKGNSWQKIYTFTGVQINDFAVSSTDTSYIYFSTNGGVYLSTNSGYAFTKRSSNANEKIKVNPLNKNSAYIVNSGSLYKSTDAALTFTRIGPSGSDFEINYTDTNTIISASGNLIAIQKTTNGGLTWEPKGQANGLFDFYSSQNISLDPQNPNIVYASITGDGIYKSIDGGNNWFQTRLLTSIPLAVGFINNNSFVVGSEGRGLLKTTNQGITWQISENTSGSAIAFSGNNTNIGIAARGDYKNPLRTTDEGNTWNTMQDGYAANYIFFHPTNGTAILSGWGDMGLGPVFTSRSTNYGVTWTKVLDDTCLTDLVFDPNNNNIVYALSNEAGGVFKSTNTGQTWSRIYIEGNVFTNIVIDKQSNIYIGKRGGLAMSSDNGITWKSIDSTLKLIDRLARISSLWADPNKSGRLYAGLSWSGTPFSEDYGGGLYLTENFGKSWRRITREQVTFFVKKNGDYIYMDSRFGLVRLLDTLTVTGVNDDNEFRVADNYYLTQNYPNPFNPSTTINFAVPSYGMVSLKVYDILGKEISSLVNEYKPAGNYSVQFNGAGLTSGVYFYKLSSEGYSSVRKMLLLK